MKIDKKIYSLDEVAEIIGMSWVWVDRMIRAGKINVIHMGGTRKITADELARIIADGVK